MLLFTYLLIVPGNTQCLMVCMGVRSHNQNTLRIWSTTTLYIRYRKQEAQQQYISSPTGLSCSSNRRPTHEAFYAQVFAGRREGGEAYMFPLLLYVIATHNICFVFFHFFNIQYLPLVRTYIYTHMPINTRHRAMSHIPGILTAI